MGDRVVIVASGELMSLFAANNIARVVLHHVDEGVRLAGIVFNVKRLDDGIERSLHRFAETIRARVLGFIPWDPLVKDAERARCTVFETAPSSRAADGFKALARVLAEPIPDDLPMPAPLDRRAFLRFSRELDL